MEASSNQWEVYRDAVAGKYYDPFRLLASLHHYANGKLNDLTRDQANPASQLQLASVGRKAFGLSPVDPTTGEGTPDAVVLLMVEKFAEYARGKGSGAGNWRTYALPSTARPASSAP